MYRWFLNKFMDEKNLTGMRKIASFEYVKRNEQRGLVVLSRQWDQKTKQKTNNKHPHDLQAFKSEAAVRSL